MIWSERQKQKSDGVIYLLYFVGFLLCMLQEQEDST